MPPSASGSSGTDNELELRVLPGTDKQVYRLDAGGKPAYGPEDLGQEIRFETDNPGMKSADAWV